MFKKTALVAGIGLALSVTAQADYQWELGGDYTYGEVSADVKNNSIENRSEDLDVNAGGLFGTYYLENVDTSKGPLNEAAFLDHASNITIFGNDGELDLSSLDRDLDDEDVTSYGIESRYVAEGPGWKLSGWLMDLGYEYIEVGDATEVDVVNVGIGKYLTPNTTLVLDYENYSVNNGGDTDGYGLSLDHFFPFSSGGLKVGLDGGKTVVKDDDDVESYGIDGTWYFSNNFGIGAGYENTTLPSGAEVDAWSVNGNWFITESFAMDLEYANRTPDDIDIPNGFGGGHIEVEDQSVTLGAKLRF